MTDDIGSLIMAGVVFALAMVSFCLAWYIRAYIRYDRDNILRAIKENKQSLEKWQGG